MKSWSSAEIVRIVALGFSVVTVSFTWEEGFENLLLVSEALFLGSDCAFASASFVVFIVGASETVDTVVISPGDPACLGKTYDLCDQSPSGDLLQQVDFLACLLYWQAC